MKRFLPAAAVLLFMTALPLFAATPTPRLVDDVIRMSKAGVGDDIVLSFVAKTEGQYDVTADDIIAMTQGGVSKPVIDAMVKGSGPIAGNRISSIDSRHEGNSGSIGDDWRRGNRTPVSDADGRDGKGDQDGDSCTTECVQPPDITYYPYYGWNPFFDPWWWYGPGFFASDTFFFRGHGFGGHGGHHGGDHGHSSGSHGRSSGHSGGGHSAGGGHGGGGGHGHH